MRLNPDLVRALMTNIQNNYDIKGYMSNEIIIEGYDEEEISYNLQLLDDANYVILKETTSMNSLNKTFLIIRLTYSGEEFLALSENQGAWEKVKKLGESFTFEIAKSIMMNYMLHLMNIK